MLINVLCKMGRGFYVLIVVFLTVLSTFELSAQQTLGVEQVDQTDALLINLSRSGIGTNTLYDRSFPLADVSAYTGLLGTQTSKSEHFYQAYYELYNASYDRSNMITSQQLRDRAANNYGVSNISNNLPIQSTASYPIGIIYYNYNDIIETAVSDNLIRYDNGSLYDVPNRPRSPYRTRKAVIASPLLHAGAPFYKPGSLSFKLDPAFFITNTGASLQYCQIDFGDGNGLRTVYPNNTVQVYYGSPGQRNIDIRIFTSDGQQSQAYASAYVVESAFGDQPYADWNDNAVCNQAPVQFEVTGESWSDNQYRPGNSTSYGAKGTVSIYFARGNCQSKALRKVVVFLDGFDPTNDRDYKAIYKDYINDEDVGEGGSNLKLGDKFRNDGYDIVVVDYEDSGDFIERNGLMAQKVLQELWSRYSSTIEQDFVMIGPSMGALVAQYALANAERRGINLHTRLFISFDGPHRGANIPIGLQQLVGFGLRSKIAEPTPANACQPKSGIVEDNFYLNIPSAKQMLIHHYLAYSETPAPHPFRSIFLQNVINNGLPGSKGYPINNRKIAVINGSKRAVVQRAGPSSSELNRDLRPSEDILRLEVRSQAANFFFSNDKTLLGWGATTTPIYNRSNTFHAFTSNLLKRILGINEKIHDDYARPYTFALDKSVDLLPGGSSNTMELIVRKVREQREFSKSLIQGCIHIGGFNTPVGMVRPIFRTTC